MSMMPVESLYSLLTPQTVAVPLPLMTAVVWMVTRSMATLPS